MERFILTKDDPTTVYFKCKNKYGHTFTSSKKEAMIFNDKSQAINYNHHVLYGECEALEISTPSTNKVIK